MGCGCKSSGTVIRYQVITPDKTQRGDLTETRAEAVGIREDGDKIKPVRVPSGAETAPIR